MVTFKNLSLSVCLLLAISLSCLCDGVFGIETEGSARALLAFDKEMIGALVAGRNVTISYTIHNVGTRTATEVQLKDLSYPQSRFDLDKPARSSWDELAPGQSVSHVVKVLPKRTGQLFVAPASVSYLDGEHKRVSKLAAEDSFFVEELLAYRRRSDSHGNTWIIFFVALLTLGVAPFGVSASMTRSLSTISSGKKKS